MNRIDQNSVIVQLGNLKSTNIGNRQCLFITIFQIVHVPNHKEVEPIVDDEIATKQNTRHRPGRRNSNGHS